MALKPLSATLPLGQYDGKDDELTTLKGGEVVTFTSVNLSVGDKAAADAFDGYAGAAKRTYVSLVKSGTPRPLMLADEGVAGYGTLFGTVIGGSVGQVTTGGTVLGPSTALASGKVTVWDKPGLFAVSLDAVDTAATTGLQPGNATLSAGSAVYPNANGVLTAANGTGAQTSNLVGRFVEFATSGSLVTTSSNLVGALNPPDGSLGTVTKGFSFAVISFHPVLT